MKRVATGTLAVLLFACGSTGKPFVDDDAGPGSDSGPGIDTDATIRPSDGAVQTCGEGGVLQDGQCAQCVDIKLQIATQQSCAMTILNGFKMDGEGFITVNAQQRRVFAMDRWGNGHVVAWCDSTTMPELLKAFDVRGYLGQVPNARVASFGDNFLCNPQAYTMLPMWMQYLGQDLPAKYKGNAQLLAQDWDVVVFCGFRIAWPNDWTSEIGAFVSTHGKGFLAAMDYEGVVMQQDFTNMSKITTPAGIQFDPLSLPWSPATLTASLSCVPDVPPPPK